MPNTRFRVAKMSVRLGQLASLDLLRGFVAVGRRMSITLAADDLCLTQSAVSRQVRTLEAMLGVKLFVRGHRSIAFTTEGERLFACADDALAQLQYVAGILRGGLAARPVTIASSIGVTSLWLLPRLGDFLDRHPNIDIRVAANNALNNLRTTELDLAIRYCPPENAPRSATRLFGEAMTPVAHPSLGLSVLGSARELEAHTLLEFDGEYRPWFRWNEWLACQGWEGLRPKAVVRFSHYDQTIHAAIAGQGVALGRVGLIGDALADGRLATITLPQPGPVTTHSYWLIHVSQDARPEVNQVARWITAEAGKVAG